MVNQRCKEDPWSQLLSPETEWAFLSGKLRLERNQTGAFSAPAIIVARAGPAQLATVVENVGLHEERPVRENRTKHRPGESK